MSLSAATGEIPSAGLDIPSGIAVGPGGNNLPPSGIVTTIKSRRRYNARRADSDHTTRLRVTARLRLGDKIISQTQNNVIIQADGAGAPPMVSYLYRRSAGNVSPGIGG
jgi:hypothetical protein